MKEVKIKNIHAYGVLLALSLLIPAAATQAAGLNNSIYVPVEPCRVGNSAPTKVTDGNSVEWLAYGSDLSSQGGAGAPGCPQPKTGMKPIGAALNITVVGNQATGNGNVVAYPADVLVAPSSSLVNYKTGTNIANSTIVGLCQDGVCDGRFKLQSNNSDVPVIADVQGYFYPAPGNVANVALSGGDYTSPVDAMADVASWCGTPSASNTCLVKIAPGTYDLGSNQIVMQPWVSIQGSGQNATKVTGAVSTSGASTSAVVLGANNVTLTNLSIENTGGGGANSIAIYNSGASPKIEHVTASASGGTISNYSVFNVFSSSPTMTSVTATGSGGLSAYGIFNNLSSSPVMKNITATGSGGSSNSYGVWILNSAPFIQDSILTGGTKGLDIRTFSSGTQVVNSKIVGGVGDVPSTTNCRGNYDANLANVTC